MPTTTIAQYRWKRILDARTHSITVNPQNPNTIYAGGMEGNFFRSFDGGTTWDNSIIFDNGYPDISALFIDPLDTNVLLLGGENMNRLQRSSNTGSTWQRILGNDTVGVTVADDVIITNPSNQNIIYCTASGGFYRSLDHGISWTKITIISSGADVCTLAVRSDSSNVIIAGCKYGYIFISQDSGKKWILSKVHFPYQTSQTNFELETPKIVMSPSNPMVGYATMMYAGDVVVQPNCGLYKTTDGGYNWQFIAYKDTSMWGLAIRKKNGNDELFVGGFSIYSPFPNIFGSGIIRFSQDDGIDWHSFPTIPWWKNDSTPAGNGNVWMMKFFGTAPNEKLYMATDAGLFVMENDPSGIEESKPQADTRLSISQNGRIYFQSEASSPFFQIANLLGQTVAEGKLNERDGDFAVGEFSLSGLQHGVYVAQVSDGKTSVAKVFVK